jgi:hypothetical protein
VLYDYVYMMLMDHPVYGIYTVYCSIVHSGICYEVYVQHTCRKTSGHTQHINVSTVIMRYCSWRLALATVYIHQCIQWYCMYTSTHNTVQTLVWKQYSVDMYVYTLYYTCSVPAPCVSCAISFSLSIGSIDHSDSLRNVKPLPPCLL